MPVLGRSKPQSTKYEKNYITGNFTATSYSKLKLGFPFSEVSKCLA